MNKTYIAPALMQYKLETLPLMISVDKGGSPVTDPNEVQSRRFWSGSLFDDEDEEETDSDF